MKQSITLTQCLMVSAMTSCWPSLRSAEPATNADPGYTLHEWGTFTTVSGSDGALLEGLQREEEALPSFVESYYDTFQFETYLPRMRSGKGIAVPVQGVTVKMETPVIYFYTDKPFQAHVDVRFKGGTISQWFPPRSGGEHREHEITSRIPGSTSLDSLKMDFAKPYEGHITWDVAVTPPSADDAMRYFRPGETPTWIYPRVPEAASVKVGEGHEEGYLFYRGLGRFSLPITFTASDAAHIEWTNHSNQAIPGGLYFSKTGPQVTFGVIPPIIAGSGGKLSDVTLQHFTEKNAPVAGRAAWLSPVYSSMHKLLVDTGLYPAEAHGMVQTWWRSYFEQDGTRVFWIVPQEETAKILPLNVTPAPKNQVRVLVGRSEILTPEFEAKLVAETTAAAAEKKPVSWAHDRFGEAYAKRVTKLQSVSKLGTGKPTTAAR